MIQSFGGHEETKCSLESQTHKSQFINKCFIKLPKDIMTQARYNDLDLNLFHIEFKFQELMISPPRMQS